MAIRLHTAVGDEIRRVAQTNPELAAEMRMSPEYRDEVMGRFDEEIDPYDEMERDEREPDVDFCPECGKPCEAGGYCQNPQCEMTDGEVGAEGPEDMGWDGGMEA